MPASSSRSNPSYSIGLWDSNVIDAAAFESEAADPLASPPEAQKSVDELIAATGGGANAIFDFRHKVFALPGARFALDQHKQAAMFHIYLGNLAVSLTPLVLRREFSIEVSSLDSQLIELASQALRHVKEVRPGDSIPKELVDGSASWSVEERHRLLAKAKLLAQVATWFAQDGAAASVEDLLAVTEDDLVAKEEFQNAFAQIAQSLGLDRSRSQEIIDHIDSIARELCYIEALRDHAGQMRSIHEKVLQLSRMAKGDPEISEGLRRAQTLLKQPVAEFSNRFAQVDAQTSDLLAMLRNPHGQIKIIREARDDIHSNLLPWNDIFDRWRDQQLILNHSTDESVHALYHWLAAKYAPSRVWR
jgi:hypothetical protein